MPTNRNLITGRLSYFLCITVLLSGGLLSCNKKNKASDIPKITFVGMSGDSVNSGGNQIIAVKFTFADGDADLGVSPSSGNFDIYTTDSRDTSKINYYFPKGLAETVDPTQGITGDCTINLEAAFMLLRPSRPDQDTVRYEFYIKDKAGNESNRFTTPDIIIVP